MGALMTREEVAAAWNAAVERRSRERRYVRDWTELERRQAWLENRELPERRLYDPDFTTKSAADFWDDRIIERNSSWWGRPETPVLTALAAAARDGSGDGVLAAVKLARHLTPAAQFAVFGQLRLWRRHEDAPRFGAEQAAGRILAEYERLRLPVEDPAQKQQAERRKPPWERAYIDTEAAS